MENELEEKPKKKQVYGKMTPKREAFCQAVIRGMTYKDAYMSAYDCKDMKESTIYVAALTLKKVPVVADRIKELQLELQRDNKITVDKVLAELAHIAFDDIKNYMDFRTEKKIVGVDENNEPIYSYNPVVDIKDSAMIDTRAISEVVVDNKGNLKFKLYSKDTALAKLGQYLGLFIDKSEVTGKDGGPIEVDDARKLLVERLAKKPHQDGD